MLDRLFKLKDYKEISFIPFHRIKKNLGEEPYLKSIDIFGTSYCFFKYNLKVYIIKPTEKRDTTKWLCTEVKNPITKRSVEGSITGNCAKGVKKEFIEYLSRLQNSNLGEKEIFRHIVLNIDDLD